MILVSDEGVDRPIVYPLRGDDRGLPAEEKATLMAGNVALHGDELLGAFSVVSPGHRCCRGRPLRYHPT